MMTTRHSLGHSWSALTLSLGAAIAAFCLARAAAADDLVRPDDEASGALLLRTSEPGRYLEAPRLRTDVSIRVSGTIARTRITQVFENPSDRWVEGLYVFPLPEDSGVDTLRMQVGTRFLEGQIQERQAARRIYERAAAEGKKAALVEQQRPNVFTNAVANIDPHGTVVVQLEYQQLVRLDGDLLSLRVPLVVAPRYASAAAGEPIRAPLADPARGKVNPVTLSVDLRAGVPLAGIASAYHTVRVERPDDSSATVQVVGDTPADCDFVLNWRLAPSPTPRAAVFQEEAGGQRYYLALIVPAVGPAARQRLPRESIYVIDNSGSMAGESMRQAKASLLFALRALAPGDRFNVIRFDDTLEPLFPAPVPADRTHLDAAERFVERLEAAGGTEILPALRAALADPTPGDDTRLRQVLLLTDGAVGNEDQLLAEVGRSLGRSRLFTIGIGSAPNSYLMEHLARLGRGTFTHVGSEQEVGLRVTGLLAKLESPVLADLVATGAPGLEVWPNPVPDLYAGEPIVLTAAGAGAGTLALAGRSGRTPWSAALDLGSAVPGAGVERIWAREKIRAIEEWRFRGAAQSDVDAEVLKVALQHHLVSRLTSLVAVDVTPSRPANEPLESAEVPLNLPRRLGLRPRAGARGASRAGERTPREARRRPGPERRRPQAAGDRSAADRRGHAARARRRRAARGAGPRAPQPAARRSAPMLRRHTGPRLAAAVCLTAGAAFGSHGLYLQAKALLAQVLLERAWRVTVASGRDVKPWPWADTWPVARLQVPRLGRSAIVLSAAGGEALAFAPAHVAGSALPGQRGTSVIAGHRDTHFRFLRELAPGDEIELTTARGERHRFRVTRSAIVHAAASGIEADDGDSPRLALVTCWPFDAFQGGSRLRYVVFAESADGSAPR